MTMRAYYVLHIHTSFRHVPATCGKPNQSGKFTPGAAFAQQCNQGNKDKEEKAVKKGNVGASSGCFHCKVDHHLKDCPHLTNEEMSKLWKEIQETW